MAFHKPLRLQQGAATLRNDQSLRSHNLQFDGEGTYRMWATSSILPFYDSVRWSTTQRKFLVKSGSITATTADGINWIFASGMINANNTTFGPQYQGTYKDVEIKSLAFINNRIMIGTSGHPGMKTAALLSVSVY